MLLPASSRCAKHKHKPNSNSDPNSNVIYFILDLFPECYENLPTTFRVCRANKKARNQAIYSRGNEYHITGFPRAVPLAGDSVTAVIGRYEKISKRRNDD